MSEKQTHRSENDVPIERAVLEREYLALRRALSMPSQAKKALLSAQVALNSLSFKDAQINKALEDIQKALEHY